MAIERILAGISMHKFNHSSNDYKYYKNLTNWLIMLRRIGEIYIMSEYSIFLQKTKQIVRFKKIKSILYTQTTSIQLSQTPTVFSMMSQGICCWPWYLGLISSTLQTIPVKKKKKMEIKYMYVYFPLCKILDTFKFS